MRYLNMDHTSAFERIGLPSHWDNDLKQTDFAVLANHVRNELQDREQGAVLDFRTDYRFEIGQITTAAAHGISTIILSGPLDSCWESRRKRQEARGKGTPSKSNYYEKNEPTVELYSRDEFAKFRVHTLNIDGSPRFGNLLPEVDASLAGQRANASK